MPPLRRRMIAGTLSLLGATAPAYAGFNLNSLSTNALAGNALANNALSNNSLSANALATNALSNNALSGNSLSSNSLSVNALAGNSLSRGAPGPATLAAPGSAVADLNGVAVEGITLPGDSRP